MFITQTFHIKIHRKKSGSKTWNRNTHTYYFFDKMTKCAFLKHTKPAKSQTILNICKQSDSRLAVMMQNSIQQRLSTPFSEGIESASSNFEDHNTQQLK